MERSFDLSKIKSIPGRFASLVGIIDPFLRYADSFVGQHEMAFHTAEVSPELLELSERASISPFHIKRWMSRMLISDVRRRLYVNQGMPNIRLQMRYLSQYRNMDPETIESEMTKMLDRNTKHLPFLAEHCDERSLLSGLVVAVSDRFRTEGGGKKKSKNWYEKVLEASTQTDQAAAEFMRKLKYRQNKIVGNPLADRYLNAFEQDLRLHIAEVLNGATSHAILSTLSGHDGVVTHAMKIGIPQGSVKDAVAEVGSLDTTYSDGRPSTFSQASRGVFEMNNGLGKKRTYVHIPIFVSGYDTARYAHFLRDTMVELNSGLDELAPHANTSMNKTVSSLALGPRGSLYMRGTPEEVNGIQTKEARVSLQLDELSIRTDCDYKRDSISMDFGSIHFEEILKYLKLLQKVDQKAPLFDVLSSHGSIGRFTAENGFGPSLMNPYGDPTIRGDHTLTDSNRMAILASVFATSGSDVGLRINMDTFGYHTQEHVNDPEFLQNFPTIVSALNQSLILPVR